MEDRKQQHNISADALNPITSLEGIVTKRPENSCADCNYSWFPRGKSVSIKCPRCQSRRVTLANAYLPSIYGDDEDTEGAVGLAANQDVNLPKPWLSRSRFALLCVVSLLVVAVQFWDDWSTVAHAVLPMGDRVPLSSQSSSVDAQQLERGHSRALGEAEVSGKLSSPESISYSPSFDCRQMRNLAEAAICRDSALSQLDREYAQRYAVALAVTDNPAVFRREGLKWLQERNQSCEVKEYLESWYAQRLVVLDSVFRHPPR